MIGLGMSGNPRALQEIDGMGTTLLMYNKVGLGESGKKIGMKLRYPQIAYDLVRLDKQCCSGVVEIFFGSIWLNLLPTTHRKNGPNACNLWRYIIFKYLIL